MRPAIPGKAPAAERDLPAFAPAVVAFPRTTGLAFEKVVLPRQCLGCQLQSGSAGVLMPLRLAPKRGEAVRAIAQRITRLEQNSWSAPVDSTVSAAGQ
ncbi:hypothetical protein SKAU_G00002440 [Synaphobranchus kaupii]|uniref:Uncharacterized protein n=1 Tax=Synaphobranchus kaupii TaxID=118154 RepID=A0A9Q1JAE6_SYNKA|nr:hypothetical protein SKAU_G00002440 [Synaphobranchus kaupii]